MPKISKAEANKLGLRSGHIHTIIALKTMKLEDVKKWLKEHGYKIRHRSVANTWRFNQAPEVTGARFGSKALPNELVLVFQYY